MADNTRVVDGEVMPEQTGMMRGLMDSVLAARAALADMMGASFGGRRNMNRALGYKDKLTIRDYVERYERGGIAQRIVEARPSSTWRGGGEIIEDEDPEVTTDFEEEWDALNKRLSLWPAFEQADVKAGIGHYAIIVLGGPGDLKTPLLRMRPEEFKYVSVFGEDEAKVDEIDTDRKSPRYGRPVFYSLVPNQLVDTLLKRIIFTPDTKIHHSRVIHVAEGAPVYGRPRLKAVWNHLDNLDKVIGGGSESFWKRADAGMHFKQDPKLKEMSDPDKVAFQAQLDAYEHDLSRYIRTRGIDIEALTAPVADFRGPSIAVMAQVSATTSIPQRILMGSERGELASSQDRDEWSERIQDRRVSFAGPVVVNQTINRLVELGTLPEPEQFEARWPMVKTLDDTSKVKIGKDLASMNKDMGEMVVSADEIRDRYLGLPPRKDVWPPELMAEVEAKKALALMPPPPPRALPGAKAEGEGEVVEGEVVAAGTYGKRKSKKKPSGAKRFAQKWKLLSQDGREAFFFRRNSQVPEGRALRGKDQPARIHAAADRFRKASRRRDD